MELTKKQKAELFDWICGEIEIDRKEVKLTSGQKIQNLTYSFELEINVESDLWTPKPQDVIYSAYLKDKAMSESNVYSLAKRIAQALIKDGETEGYDLEAGLFGKEFSKVVRHFEALEAENAELRKDKERLDFLIDQLSPIAFDDYDIAMAYCDARSDRKTERQAIDAAMENENASPEFLKG